MTYREALSEFWECVPVAATAEWRLRLLRHYAGVTLTDRRVKDVKARRAQWRARTAKMNPHDWNGKECFVCEGPATQRHHIIPIGKGGLPTKKNTIWIDRGCHAAIHPWMSSGQKGREHGKAGNSDGV